MIIKRELAKYIGQRKHGSQLTKREEEGLWKRLKSIEEWEWRISDHALDRLESRGIKATKHDIITTIYNSKIVEYRITKNKKIEERVVLRSRSIVNDCYNIHVVFSLTDKKIITVWMNHIEDLHETLNWSIYNKNMKVFV